MEYQPIVELSSGEVVAYEALSRFYNHAGESVRPDLVHASQHENPITLFQVEFAQKQLQLVGWVKLDRCVLRMAKNPVFMTFVRQMI